MRKLLVLICFLGFFGAKAQVGYGLKVGVTSGEISNSLHKQHFHPSLFFNAFVDVPVSNKISIQPGINISGKGSDFIEQYNDVYLDHVFSVTTLEIPVNVVYNIPTGNTGKFQLGVGPYIGFNLSGRDNYIGHAGAVEVEESDALKFTGDKRDLNVLDAGGNFMVAYKFRNKLLLSVNYNLGLADINPNLPKNQSFRNWQFGLGFQF